MEKLRTENKRYRDTNRTAEFEAHAAKLQAQASVHLRTTLLKFEILFK